jgi:proteasome lid subunit RPN8/RPN11
MSFTGRDTPVFASRLRNLMCRPRPLLVVEQPLWQQLLGGLRTRGGGRRESGAFLLGPVHSRLRAVSAVVYYDDLDPASLTGGISFKGSAYGVLWDECEQRGLRVVADVHTHPADWVAQSTTDRAHPMLAQAGHIALIVPHFAQKTVRARDVGIHEYRGEGQWCSWVGSKAERRLRLGRRRWWW